MNVLELLNSIGKILFNIGFFTLYIWYEINEYKKRILFGIKKT